MPKLRPTPAEVRTLSQRDESLLASLAVIAPVALDQ